MNRVLITGSEGFLGCQLKESLCRQEIDVCSFDRTDGNMVQPYVLDNFVGEKQIDYVFHLAASTFVPHSWEDPLNFYQVNTMGTLNVLEFCRKRKIGMLYVSAYLYGLPDAIPVAENAPIRPNNPYAHSKYLAEQMCEFYATYFGVPINIVRPFNIYGPHQKELFLIPHIIKQVLQDEKVVVKDLEPKRDYIFIDDVVSAMISVFQANLPYGVFNIGSGYSMSVQEVIEIIQSVAHTQKPIICDGQKRQGEIMDVVADITNMRQQTGWVPQVSFEEGIAKIMNLNIKEACT